MAKENKEEVINAGEEITLRADPGLDAEEYLAARLHDTEKYAAMRVDLKKFIKDHLEEGADYGHTSTHTTGLKTLKKPGSEKINSMFGVTPVFLPDIKTWEMLGSEDGRVCYTCYLMTPQRKARAIELICSTEGEYSVLICSMLALAEGKGCGNIQERSNSTDNATVKLTLKRAQVDATLRLGGLSDVFTQDLEDGVIQPNQSNHLAIADKKVLEVSNGDEAYTEKAYTESEEEREESENFLEGL